MPTPTQSVQKAGTAQRPSEKSQTLVDLVPGLAALQVRTLGDAGILVAVVDGPVALEHPCFDGAALKVESDLALPTCQLGGAQSCDHGTRVASILFAQHGARSPLRGIAPSCSGLIVPIFNDRPSSAAGVSPTSQDLLARAIRIALHRGAKIINVSAGQLGEVQNAWPSLREVVLECNTRGVLVVAAAGNDGCDCTHLPGALPGVLVVGAAGRDHQALSLSNYGRTYSENGILAMGEDVPCAIAGGGIGAATGTSFSAPIVSGVAALLLSLVLPSARQDPSTMKAVRSAMIASAVACEGSNFANKCLSGILDVTRARQILQERGLLMSAESGPDGVSPHCPVPSTTTALFGSDASALARDDDPAAGNAVAATLPRPCTAQLAGPRRTVAPSCGNTPCTCNTTSVQLVYALGQLGHDLLTQARYDGVKSAMDEGMYPTDPRQLLGFLGKHPFYASSVAWTLNLDGSPIYAISPRGPYAAETYASLREFYAEQVEDGVERVSIPGVISGNIELMNGQVVPVIVPELRGMANWTTKALRQELLGSKKDDPDGRRAHLLESFLAKIYYKLRNFGRQPEERAINFAATNAYQVKQIAIKQSIFEQAAKAEMELDAVQVMRSPICRPDSDCWDVELSFYRVDDALQRPRQVSRFTVDVADVVPVLVGPVRSWTER